MDGGEGLRRALSEPTRQHELRQEFGNIIQHNYPGDDYKDLMAGVDELIQSWLHRREEDGCHGRQRRRLADELDHLDKRRVSRRQSRNATSRAGLTGGTPPISRSSNHRGSRRRRLKIRRIT
jgi:hypothetical protein